MNLYRHRLGCGSIRLVNALASARKEDALRFKYLKMRDLYCCGGRRLKRGLDYRVELNGDITIFKKRASR